MQTDTRPTTDQPHVTEQQLRDALKKHEGKVPEVAAELGIHRATVYKLKNRWSIKVRKTVEVS